jgi:hypothetical protein
MDIILFSRMLISASVRLPLTPGSHRQPAAGISVRLDNAGGTLVGTCRVGHRRQTWVTIPFSQRQLQTDLYRNYRQHRLFVQYQLRKFNTSIAEPAVGAERFGCNGR